MRQKRDEADSNGKPACRLIPLCPKDKKDEADVHISKEELKEQDAMASLLIVEASAAAAQEVLRYARLTLHERRFADAFYRHAIEAVRRLKVIIQH
jgi:hypothetical protein